MKKKPKEVDPVVRSFHCELCEKDFAVHESDNWSVDDAKAEFKKLYPGMDFDSSDVATVCDECHQAVMEWRKLQNEGGMLQ